ncbi:MAG: hypothetical protein E6G34_11945 [Actinobacteria bacterium]|nr:MAG: hypothetical protein E6G34_11945 [Actinomycetota bacterium]
MSAIGRMKSALIAVSLMGVTAGPAVAAQLCGTYSGHGCAPESSRVDLATPAFSNPTRVDNPLFPISSLRSAVFLGREEGRPFRSETTLLPDVGTVTWNGRRIQVLLSQYMAWRDGRLEEVARDRYAQADDGSVWYLGEDVIDYLHGHAITTEGTWLAGREGPPAMIMPAHPSLGDVFRTENVPGIVFEQVTVEAVGRTVAGPHGPVKGAIVGQELHLDGTTERKTFAPGYGEFLTGADRNVEALALAVPADALTAPTPPGPQRLGTGASGVLGSVEADDWRAARATVKAMHAQWAGLRRAGQPRLIAAKLEGALRRLSHAVHRRRRRRTIQLALDIQQSVLDLQLRYEPQESIDLGRMELWCQRLRADAASRNAAAVSGDATTLDWVRDRITHALTPDELRQLDVRLARLQAAADAGRTAAAADHAARLIGLLREIPRT